MAADPGWNQSGVVTHPSPEEANLLDQGIHVVDLFRWFAGDFGEVFGYTANYRLAGAPGHRRGRGQCLCAVSYRGSGLLRRSM